MKAKEVAGLLNVLLPTFRRNTGGMTVHEMAENASMLVDAEENAIIIFSGSGNIHQHGKFEYIKHSALEAPRVPEIFKDAANAAQVTGKRIEYKMCGPQVIIDFEGMTNLQMKNRASQIINDMQKLIDDIG